MKVGCCQKVSDVAAHGSVGTGASAETGGNPHLRRSEHGFRWINIPFCSGGCVIAWHVCEASGRARGLGAGAWSGIVVE